MKAPVIVLILAALGIAGAAQLVGLPKARVTVHVIGEDGKPIAGVNARFVFSGEFNSQAIVPVSGETDANGNFTAEGYCDGSFGADFNKTGYYSGSVDIPTFHESKEGKWQPWDNTYTTVLRKIGNPIPLYARKLVLQVPANGVGCGLDLMEADWVAPYGKGKVADINVTVTKLEYRSMADFDVSATVSFPPTDNGIQEIQLPKEFSSSLFRWPRMAPEVGYNTEIKTQSLWLNPPNGNAKSINTSKEGQAYFFRVRTVIQSGKITSALYGKILGGVAIGPDDSKSCSIGFTYYLNPTPQDRNLEFGANLFKGLPPLDEIHAP